MLNISYVGYIKQICASALMDIFNLYLVYYFALALDLLIFP